MRKLFFTVLTIYSTLSFCQTKSVDIKWLANDSSLYFKGATYLETRGDAPQFNILLPWQESEMLPKVTINTISSEQISATYSKQFERTSLKSSPWFDYQLVYENKKALLQINLEPFFFDPQTASIKKVLSFSVEIQKEWPLAAKKALITGDFKSSSVLSSGNWFKVSTEESGIYKLSYEQLQDLGLQNPATVSVYGAGAIQLPENYSLGYYDDLQQLPIYMNKGSDQLFGPGDYILFYARGPVNWSYSIDEDFYNHSLHDYATNGYYFITDSKGVHSEPEIAVTPSETASAVVDRYDRLLYHEDEKNNLLSSGREWYGDHFKLLLSFAYPFTIENLIKSENVKVKVEAIGRSNEESSMFIKINNQLVDTLNFGTVNLSLYTATMARGDVQITQYNPSNEVLTVSLEYNQPNTNSEAWLNHIILNARAKLELVNSQLIFRDIESVSFGQVSEFKLGNASSNTIIWDISDPTSPKKIAASINSGIATFKQETSELKEFIAFNPSGSFPSPRISGDDVGKVDNQDLHGSSIPDMLIVYPDIFAEQVERLAQHRIDHDGLKVQTVTQEQVFNEFSSGTKDVSALRNFLKMYYDRSGESEMTKYLLLFGDGSFDNRDTSSLNPNLIMTYQSLNSLTPTSSYVSDDFYGLLDTGEKLYDGMLDIGIGRLPVSTLEEAEAVVDKLIEYDQKETIGEWRNYICFIGDDEDGNIHMRQADILADDIENNYPSYNVNKIFMDAYPQKTTPTGDLYPDVTRAINDQVERGALIINYTGHGSPNGLAHEKVLDLNSIKNWENTGKYPLFLTATCEFSRYDEYSIDEDSKEEATSAGEEVLLNPSGGGIALFTTTRLVYSGPNHTLNEKFYELVFEKREDGTCYKMGDIIKYSKNKTGAGINKRNFTLLGDPATSLSFPTHTVITDSINHSAINTASDTISALDFVTISGHLETMNGEMLSDFDGTIIPIVYDKVTNYETLGNDGGSTMNFDLRSNILFKGNASVKDGSFEFSFFAPKDIGYHIGNGKISYYGYNQHIDAHGSTEEITIGGLGTIFEQDTAGPEIALYMNDSLFRNNGIVNSSPELLVYITDPYGINTTGNGIGHDITAILDNDRINSLNLNNYYEADLDSYNTGTVRYPYKDLEAGKHTILVRVWDIFNNSRTDSLNFVVIENSSLLLDEIYNYPNPFYDRTFFNVEHNRPEKQLEVTIRIYDLNGNLITILQEQQEAGGYRLRPLEWNRKSSMGATIGGGIYVYKVIVITEDGEQAAGSGKLIIKSE